MHVVEGRLESSWFFAQLYCGGTTDHRRPCPVDRAVSNVLLTRANALKPLGNDTPHRGKEYTYEEGECFLELGDLLLGKRISLQHAVSTLSRVLPAGWRCVDFQGGV